MPFIYFTNGNAGQKLRRDAEGHNWVSLDLTGHG